MADDANLVVVNDKIAQTTDSSEGRTFEADLGSCRAGKFKLTDADVANHIEQANKFGEHVEDIWDKLAMCAMSTEAHPLLREIHEKASQGEPLYVIMQNRLSSILDRQQPILQS